MNISVVGLGKLGLCTAACFASKGHRVLGYDSDPQHLAKLMAGECPILEPGLPELLDQARGQLTFVDDVERLVGESEVTLFVVPTPSGADGRFVNDYAETALRRLAPALATKQGFHVLDMVSTVMPGTSTQVFIPLVEHESGKRCGQDFGFVYNPEFIALGSVIRNFLNPDMVLVGASDDRSSAMVRRLYEETCDSAPTIATMSLINAEITKLTLNCYVTMKVSFANELSAICERVPGANVDVVTRAIGADTRVGSKYLRGGVGFGGPCFPRDNVAFQAFAREHGHAAQLGPKVVAVNGEVVDRLHREVSAHVGGRARVALIGVAYKPGTHIIEESQAVMLARRLVADGCEVVAYDPTAAAIPRSALAGAQLTDDPYAAIEGARAVVLLLDSPEARTLDLDRVERIVAPPALLLDCWRLQPRPSTSRLRYRALGVGPVDVQPRGQAELRP